MKKLIYFFLSTLTLPALAQQQPYESNGPKGGQARMFNVESGRTLVAARGGAYEHSSGIWKAMTPSWNSLSCVILNSLATSGPEMLVGSVRNGVYFSNDAGINWSNVSGDLRPGTTFQSVLISGPNYLGVADDSSLFLSTDQGTSWVQRNTNISNAKACYLSLHNNNIYLTSSGGLYKSVDNGQTFMIQNSSAGLDGKMLWVNDSLWIAGSNGLRMSLDDGMNFSPAGLSGMATRSIAVSGQNVFTSIRGRNGLDSVVYSGNGGGSFSNILPRAGLRFTMVYDLAVSNGMVLVGSDHGIISGNVNNTGWRADDSGFHARKITHLGFGGNNVYATAADEGVFRSDDTGAHWTAAGSALNGADNSIISSDGYNQYVYAVGATAFYRSTNNGVLYTAGATGFSTGVFTSVSVLKSNGTVMVAHNGELYRSTDNGLNFSKLTTGIPAGIAHTIFRADTSWFVAATNDSLYQAGSNLQFRNATGIWGSITGVTHNTKRYYASTRTQSLLESTDGFTWTHTSHPGTVPSQLHSIAALDSVVYIGTDNGMISNASGSWDADSLHGQIVYALGVSNKKLFAGTCYGVWARKNLPTPPPVDTGVGVPTIASNLDGFQLYPNPSGGDFKAAFTSREAGAATLTMTDIAGRAVYAANITINTGRNELQIPVAALQPGSGIYFVSVKTRSQQGIQRILIRSN